jgi:hypothetical protein
MMFNLTDDSGAICGAPAAAWVADRFGRRVGMFLGGLIILAGMAIAASAKTIAQVGNLYALHLIPLSLPLAVSSSASEFR